MHLSMSTGLGLPAKLAFEKGRLAKFKGMNLDDISIGPD
ncbi:hypothetical protein NFI96_022074, partial [Prochilodus magdalenae]